MANDARNKAIHAKKLGVKSRGSSIGFDKKWKIWQKPGGESEKVVHLKAYDKDARRRVSKKKINSDDIPF